MLLPPDLRDWVPEDDMVHFIIEAVDQMPLKDSDFHINHRGTGSKQYSPRMMLALMIYCYANGIFSSRKIEKATYRDIAVRYLTADQHPDHDTIATFRRRNHDLFAKVFLELLKLATEMGVLKVGTVSIDGTHIDANASKSKSLRFDRATALEKQLTKDIDKLMTQAEAADNAESDDGQSLPDEIARREKLRAKMQEAQANLRRRAEAKTADAHEEYERKLEQYEERKKNGRGGGNAPKPPENKGPKPTDQANLTDDDSRLMRKNRRAEFRQSYNAQAVVDADGTQLVLGGHVTNCASDHGQLEPALASVDPSLGRPTVALADNGYSNADALERIESSGIDAYVSVTSEDGNNHRRYDFRPPKEKKPTTIRDSRLLKMKSKLETDAGRKLYSKRKHTVEPVFGIIKSVLGFRRFHLRGLKKVATEWCLVRLAYNAKRLYALDMAFGG